MARDRRLLMLAEAASVHTSKWAGEFARRGWDVHVVSLRPGETPGATVHVLGDRLTRATYALAALRCRELVRTLQPAIIHAHYATSYGFLGAVSKFAPLVTSLWGSDAYDFPRKSPFHAALLRFNLRRADVITAASRDLACAAQRHAPGRTIEIVPFGVDLRAFFPATVADADSDTDSGADADTDSGAGAGAGADADTHAESDAAVPAGDPLRSSRPLLGPEQASPADTDADADADTDADTDADA
ncbi:MAG: glycosyltransferase, partial [Candidatus Sericytochromatia bacterium]|nr:glycosyltransferase [Candidatus Tanganyikabacteria bacterium]